MVTAIQPITVLLTDPNALTRGGLRTLVAADPRFALAGEAGGDAPAHAHRLQPNLVVLDPAVHGAIDLELLRDLHDRSPKSRLIVLTAAFEPHAFMAAMLARVHGYLLKESIAQADLIREALALIARFGVVVVDSPIAEQFWSYPGSPIAVHIPGLAILTTREVGVLTLFIRENQTAKEIADRLHFAVNTVHWHVEQVAHNLGAASPLRLGWLLHERGLL